MSRFLQMEQRRQARAVVVDESTALKLQRIDPTLPFLHPRDKGVSRTTTGTGSSRCQASTAPRSSRCGAVRW